MSLHNKNNLVCVIGKSGSGKTWLIRDLVRGNANFFPGKVFVWGEGANFGNFYGLHPRQIAISHLAHVAHKKTQAAKVIIWESPFFHECLGALAALSTQGKVWFVCDEIDREYKSKQQVIPTIASVVHTGRHEIVWEDARFKTPGVSALWGFRRLQNVPNDLLSQAHTIFLKKVVKLGDIALVNKELGEDDLAPSVVRSLDKPEFLRFDEGNFSEESDLLKLQISEDTLGGRVARTIASRWQPRSVFNGR